MIALLCAVAQGLVFTGCSLNDDNAVVNPDDNGGGVKSEKTILLMSDIHVMAPKLLVSKGDAFRNYLANDPKLLEYSVEILEQIVSKAIESHPDLVVIPGDLTKDGELLSHQMVVSILSTLRSTGIPVVVVPGNHDILNPDGEYYDGDEKRPAERTSPEKFAELYADFGYSQAFARDEASLSFAVEPLDGLVLLCLDTNKYDDNLYLERGDSCNYNQVAGRIREATLQWALDEADKAHEKGKQVVVVQHHNMVQHYDGQNILHSGYTIDDYEDVAKQMMEHGIHLALTGHQHLHDVAQYRVNDGEKTDSIVDIATGSTLQYPSPWRTIVVSDGFTRWQMKTEYVTSVPSLSNLKDTGYMFLYGYLKNTKIPKLITVDVDEMIVPQSMSDFISLFCSFCLDEVCQMFIIHDEANENENQHSAGLMTELRTKFSDTYRQHLLDKGMDEATASATVEAVVGVYDSSIAPIVQSILQDVNQLQDETLSSRTDDLSAVLTLPKP